MMKKKAIIEEKKKYTMKKYRKWENNNVINERMTWRNEMTREYT